MGPAWQRWAEAVHRVRTAGDLYPRPFLLASPRFALLGGWRPVKAGVRVEPTTLRLSPSGVGQLVHLPFCVLGRGLYSESGI